MRIPRITSGQAPSLSQYAESPYEAADRARAPYEVAKAAVKTADQFLIYRDRVKANQRYQRDMQVRQEASDIAAKPFVDVDDPRLANIVGQIEADPDDIVNVTDEKTGRTVRTYPSYMALQYLMDDEQTWQDENKLTSRRQKDMYDQMAGETIKKADRQLFQNIEAGNIQAASQAGQETVKLLANNADYEGAYEQIESLYRSNLLTDKQRLKLRDEVMEVATDKYTAANTMLMEHGITAARASDPAGVVNAVNQLKSQAQLAVDMKILSKEKADENLKNAEYAIEDGIRTRQIQNMLTTLGWEDAEATLQTWSTMPPPGGADPKKWDASVKRYQSMVTAFRERANRAVPKQTEEYKKQSRAVMLQLAMNAGGTIPVHQIDYEKAINERWNEAIMPAWSQMLPGQERNRFLADQIVSMQMIPKRFGDYAGSVVGGGDPNAIRDLVEVFDSVKDRRPAIAGAMGGGTAVAMLTQLRNIYDTRGEVTDADITAAHNQYFANPEGYDINIGREAENFKRENLYVSSQSAAIDMGIDPFWFSKPEVSGQFTADYELNMRQLVGAGADWKTAHEASVIMLQKSWSNTMTDPLYPKGKPMRFSPEAMSGMSSDSLNRYKRNYLERYAPEQLKEHGIDNFVLVSDAMTSSVGGIPSYEVHLRTNPNIPELSAPVITEKGFLRFKPNPEYDPEIQKQLKERDYANNQIDAYQSVLNKMGQDLTRAMQASFSDPDANIHDVWSRSVVLMNEWAEELKTDPAFIKDADVPGKIGAVYFDEKKYWEFWHQLNDVRETIYKSQLQQSRDPEDLPRYYRPPDETPLDLGEKIPVGKPPL